MQYSPSVKVTFVKKRRPSSQRSIKSATNSVKVTRVKSVTARSEKVLVVENVDTIPTVHHESLTPSLSKKSERPFLTVPAANTSRLPHSDRSESGFARPVKSHTIIPIQDNIRTYASSKRIPQSKQKDSFKSNTTTQLFDSSSISFPKSKGAKINEFSTNDWRGIHTIGKEKTNNNKKSQLCKQCSLRYYLAFGIALLLIVGIIIAVPVIVVASMMTTTTMLPSTTVTTATTTSVTTATAAATVTITSNACTSSWMGIKMIYHCGSCSVQSAYAPLSFNYVAIANVTRITFALRRDAGYFGIDDVSICDTAAPANELLSNGGFENGSFSSWTHCVQSGSPLTGSVQSTASGISYNNYTFTARSGAYYYLGGATINTEYLSQTFPSIIGHTYIFSFAYVYVGNGSLSSGDFLLSI